MHSSSFLVSFTLLLMWVRVEAAFVHPGVVVTKDQLDFIKEQVEKKIDPIYTAFVNANKTAACSPSYKVRVRITLLKVIIEEENKRIK